MNHSRTKLAAIAAAAAMTLVPVGAASAKQGADDPPGHVRHGNGADDAQPHLRNGADDSAAARPQARRGNGKRGQRRNGRLRHHGPNHR
jgi:hypothetical protein